MITNYNDRYTIYNGKIVPVSYDYHNRRWQYNNGLATINLPKDAEKSFKNFYQEGSRYFYKGRDGNWYSANKFPDGKYYYSKINEGLPKIVPSGYIIPNTRIVLNPVTNMNQALGEIEKRNKEIQGVLNGENDPQHQSRKYVEQYTNSQLTYPLPSLAESQYYYDEAGQSHPTREARRKVFRGSYDYTTPRVSSKVNQRENVEQTGSNTRKKYNSIPVKDKKQVEGKSSVKIKSNINTSTNSRRNRVTVQKEAPLITSSIQYREQKQPEVEPVRVVEVQPITQAEITPTQTITVSASGNVPTYRPEKKFNRKETRQMLRQLGINPYSLSGAERNDFRKYLNKEQKTNLTYQTLVNNGLISD